MFFFFPRSVIAAATRNGSNTNKTIFGGFPLTVFLYIMAQLFFFCTFLFFNVVERTV